MLVNLSVPKMSNKNKIDKALSDKFITKEKFSEDVELLVLHSGMNYIDAIVDYCSNNGIEIETVSKLISRPLKEKLRVDAMHLNYLSKTSLGKLPF